MSLPASTISRGGEITPQPEESSDPAAAPSNPQAAFFPKTDPLPNGLNRMDMNGLSPIKAGNKSFEWQKIFQSRGKLEKTPPTHCAGVGVSDRHGCGPVWRLGAIISFHHLRLSGE